MKHKTDDIVEFQIDAKHNTFGRIFSISFSPAGKTYHITDRSRYYEITPNKILGSMEEELRRILTIEDLYI